MVREATSDRTAFSMPVIIPTKDIPEHQMESSQEKHRDEEDHGEGTLSDQHQQPALPEFEGEAYYEDND